MRPFDRDFQEVDPQTAAKLFETQPQGGQLTTQGQTQISMAGGFITAQKVAVERDEEKILSKLKILAGAAGTDYFYSWNTNNKDGTKGEVSGPTIKLANDVMRVYGNCVISVDVRATDTHHVFAARITDLESGASMTRLFQQRKSQNTGMKDKDRQEDIIFQIGQSKSIRNVIANFLATFVDYSMEEARKSQVERFGKNIEKSRTWISEAIADMKIDIALVEKYVGRKLGEWTARDIAKVASTMQAIFDGMTTVEDVFPSGTVPSAVGTASNKAPPPPSPSAPAATSPASTPPPAPSSTPSSPPEPAATEPDPAKQSKKSPPPTPTSMPPPMPAPSPLIDDSDLDEKSKKLRIKIISEFDALIELAKAPDSEIGWDSVLTKLARSKKDDPRRKELSPADEELVSAACTERMNKLMGTD